MAFWFSKPKSPENPRCGVCATQQREARALIAGPEIYVCDVCVVVAERTLTRLAWLAETSCAEPEPLPAAPTFRAVDDVNRCCAFCGKSQREVDVLLVSGALSICNECVGLCTDIVEEVADGLELPAKNG